jgi:hypothetical protein
MKVSRRSRHLWHTPQSRRVRVHPRQGELEWNLHRRAEAMTSALLSSTETRTQSRDDDSDRSTARAPSPKRTPASRLKTDCLVIARWRMRLMRQTSVDAGLRQPRDVATSEIHVVIRSAICRRHPADRQCSAILRRCRINQPRANPRADPHHRHQTGWALPARPRAGLSRASRTAASPPRAASPWP